MTAKTKQTPVDAKQVDALLKVLNTHNVTDENGERRYTFATRNRDAHDFSNVSVWTLKAMLAQAYYLGKVDGQTDALSLLGGK
jgi:hypothetical protein